MISNSFCENSFNDFLDVFAASTVVETLADAYQVACLVQLPRQLICPWPESKQGKSGNKLAKLGDAIAISNLKLTMADPLTGVGVRRRYYCV